MVNAVFLFNPPFCSYGGEHLSWLLAGALSTCCWIYFGNKQPDDLGKRRLGLVMSMIPALLWLSISGYLAFFEHPLDLGLVLPFHVCYFLNLMMPLMMWQRSYFLFEISYFMIMGGCMQALITPDVPTTFPHYMNLRYFVIHICLVQSMLFAIFVFDFRPTWKSWLKSFCWVNLYFVFILGVNALLGTNFMYLRQKPNTTTLLDLFGDWPWYILGGELLALVLFTLVMMPFALTKPKSLAT